MDQVSGLLRAVHCPKCAAVVAEQGPGVVLVRDDGRRVLVRGGCDQVLTNCPRRRCGALVSVQGGG